MNSLLGGGGLSGQVLKIQSGDYGRYDNLWTPLWGGFIGALMGVKMSENNPIYGGADAYVRLTNPNTDPPTADYGQTYTVLNPAQDVKYKYLEGNIYYGLSTYTFGGDYSNHFVFEEQPVVYVIDFAKIAHLLNQGSIITVADVTSIQGAVLDSFEASSDYIDDGILHPLPAVNVDSNTKIILMANPTNEGGS